MRIHFCQTFEEDEAKSELADLLDRVAARKRLLAERWRLASSYDRMQAVARLLQEARLEPNMKIELWEKHEAVQAAWAKIRAVRWKTDVAARLPEPPRDLPLWKHAITMGEVELQRHEAERDRVLAAHGLWEDLFTTGESWLLATPYTTEMVPLRELLSVQGALEDRVKDFERMADERARAEVIERTRAKMRFLPPVSVEAELQAAE
jgi:hypothetical protein